MKLWILRKRLNSFRLVVRLKESGREFQNLAVTYLTELKPYVVVLGFGKANTCAIVRRSKLK